MYSGAGDRLRLYRNYGYDVLINNFEENLRAYVANAVLLPHYGESWRDGIPNNVITQLLESKEDTELVKESDMATFFDELYLQNLKDILLYKDHFKLASGFLGDLPKSKFSEVMDELNVLRKKIAHAKSTFSELDFENLVRDVRILCQGESAINMSKYLQKEGYKSAKEIPQGFFQEYSCKNNLISEDYDADGGFVGREREKEAVRKLIQSDQDRIITVNGAGGVGKTAIALNIAHSYARDPQNPFEAILWFTAKTKRLSESGIEPADPTLTSYAQLLPEMLSVIDQSQVKTLRAANAPTVSYRNLLYEYFSTYKCLIVIDNLETVISDSELVEFIKDVPRNSKVLITSRKGLGEIERRYSVSDMSEKDAVRLFRLVARERGALGAGLLRLSDEKIVEFVRRVRCYPLLVKWSIGQICLGKEINRAFAQITEGSSDIAIFVFNDIFEMLSRNAKTVLYSMIAWGDKPIPRAALTQISNLDEAAFEDAIEELVIASFVFPEPKEEEGTVRTQYTMLSLTRGYVSGRFDSDEKERNRLMTRYYHWLEDSRELEVAMSDVSQQMFLIGIKSVEDRVAYNYVKSAKLSFQNGKINEARKAFEKAIDASGKLAYAYAEYSKFEQKLEHYPKALELARQAVRVDPENWHAVFNLGCCLRRTGEPREAVKILKKAKELNKSYLPIYNELGLALTKCGEYEAANLEFDSALKEERFPNVRHKAMTLQFKAENYRAWADGFRMRHDYVGSLQKLTVAKQAVDNAIQVNPSDFRLPNVWRDICIDLGGALWNVQGKEAGLPYFEEALSVVKLGGAREDYPPAPVVVKANGRLLNLLTHERVKDVKRIIEAANAGLAASYPGSSAYEYFNAVKRELKGEVPTDKDRRYGRIAFFDPQRGFGSIESGNQRYSITLVGFRKTVNINLEPEMKGATVSFV